MKAKIWSDLYGFNSVKPRTTYATKRQCEKLAQEKNVEIQFNYYGKRLHRLNHPTDGALISEGYDELFNDLDLI